MYTQIIFDLENQQRDQGNGNRGTAVYKYHRPHTQYICHNFSIRSIVYDKYVQ